MTVKGIMRRAVGIDFGTTNSAVAVAAADGVARLATFNDGAQRTSTFRSLLYYGGERADASGPRGIAGPDAVRCYLEAGGHGRLIQSMKSHLASRLFTETNLFGVFYTLEDLIAVLVRGLKNAAQADLGDLGARVVVGRPAHFSGALTPEDDAFALGRLRAAFAQAGFEDVAFEYEPVAAAYQYEQQLDHDELVLIGDFGGGTSDFSLIRLGPTAQRNTQRGNDILGVDGVGIAGDAFDSTIVRHAVAPHLGLGTTYRSAFDQELPVPAHAPKKIDALMHIVNDDLGYQLYRAVEHTKFELSARDATSFAFTDRPVSIRESVARPQFESWIQPKIERLDACVERLLTQCNVAPKDVGSVFLTGGSAFVPAVRRLFAAKFSADRLRGGEELTTVARGLALRALAD